MAALFALCLAWAAPVAAQTSRLEAPNVVEISPRLVTSGQPRVDQLSRLKALGFDAVVYLAPGTVQDAVADEARRVTGQGITFVNLPVRFDNPTEADFELFAALMRALGERKVLVHCQINLRASSMVFLYRVLELKESPDAAYKALSGVWKPDGAWRRMIEGVLRKHQIEFELL